MNKKLSSVLIALSLFLSTSAYADTIIKFDLGGTGPDLRFDGNVLETVSDPNGLAGDQTTLVTFTGFLEGVLANLTGASFTLSDVMAFGNANILGSFISQQTQGGTFSLFDSSDSLVLSGNLGNGVITGASGVDTGSVFNTTVFSFTGGSLLSMVSDTPAGISFALTNILSGSNVGLSTSFNPNTQSFELLGFTADSSGQITGSPIPEPTTLMLFGSAVLGGVIRKRRMSA
jgi:hypothetical protein